VQIDNPLPTRARDLQGAAERDRARFQDFLTQEVLPWVRQRYQVSADPAHVLVGGASAGGFAAAALALRHPEVFGNVLSQSGAVGWAPPSDREDQLLGRQIAATPVLPVRFWLGAGLLEGRLLVSNRHFRTVLQAKGYSYVYREFMGGHDWLCTRATVADGLLALLGERGA
jgi:enterochelin esterase family protein